MGSLQRQSMMKLTGSVSNGFAGPEIGRSGLCRGSFGLLVCSASESEDTSHGESEESNSSSSVSGGS